MMMPAVGGREVKLSRPLAASAKVTAIHATVATAATRESPRARWDENPARSPEAYTAITNALATTTASATNDQMRSGDALTMADRGRRIHAN
jgi:hypothetical protein